MEKIQIKKNTNGDSRVADHVPTIGEFDEANLNHQKNVRDLAERFCTILMNSVVMHDYTKVQEPWRTMFYRDLIDTLEGRMDNFMEGKWAKQHYYENERHHLKTYAPDDVNMFDVIEMVCDCVAASSARGGECKCDIPVEVLNKAVSNTVDLLLNEVEVVE